MSTPDYPSREPIETLIGRRTDSLIENVRAEVERLQKRGASESTLAAYFSMHQYIDEILIHRLAPGPQMQARMFIRGTNIGVPLQYVRVQPYVSPKIELSDERLERVDVRVLPVIFRFARQKDLPVYPGLLVDVYVAE